MSALHLVSKSDGSSDALRRCFKSLAANDSVLFIENGVYNILPGVAEEFLQAFPEVKFHVLEADLLARGLHAARATSISIIDDIEFVELTIRHQPILSWY